MDCWFHKLGLFWPCSEFELHDLYITDITGAHGLTQGHWWSCDVCILIYWFYNMHSLCQNWDLIHLGSLFDPRSLGVMECICMV